MLELSALCRLAEYGRRLVRLHRLHECTEPELSNGIHDQNPRLFLRASKPSTQRFSSVDEG